MRNTPAPAPAPARKRRGANAPQSAPELVRGPELPGVFRLSRSSLYRLRRSDPEFPAPVRFPGGTGLRTLLYRRADVEAYIAGLSARPQVIPSGRAA